MATINPAIVRTRGLSTHYLKDVDDNIYYNVRMYNDPNDGKDSIIASFSENRTEPIIGVPDDYELAVVRFKVPADVIPIKIWDDSQSYSVTLSYDGYDATKDLVVISVDDPSDPPYLTNAIWTYQTFIDMINNALSEAYDELKLNKPAIPSTEAPFYTYDAKSELFTFYAEQTYTNYPSPIIPEPVEIHLSYALFGLIPAQQVVSFRNVQPQNPPKFANLKIKDNKINSITYNGKPYYTFEGEYKTLALLNDFVSIVFESDSIPLNPENLPAQRNIFRRIVTDFEPLDGTNDHQAFQYYPQGPLRYYDLKSAYPLNRIDMRVYWVDRSGREYPIVLNKNNVLTLKILFRKKIRRQIERIMAKEEEDIT